MYIIIERVQIKEGFKEQFIEGLTENARSAVRDEPGCLRFDVVQDGNDDRRIWIYEVYVDEAAFHAHTRTPHFLKFQDVGEGWKEEAGLVGAGRGAFNISPTDDEWS